MGASDYYTEALHGPQEYLDLGAFALSSGRTLPSGRLAYRTFGELNAAKDNAILLPHMYSGTSGYMELFVGEDRPLDPSRYFLILPAQLGSGFGSSPSTTPPPLDRGVFPPVSIADDVRAQHALVRDHLGIDRLVFVSGWSMGGMQTYEWAVRHPELLARAMPPAACARTPDHDKLFIDVHTELLRSDPAFNGGFYRDSAEVALGLRRHATAFALMGATPEMFRGEVWRELGLASLEDYVEGFVQAYFLPWTRTTCSARRASGAMRTSGGTAASGGSRPDHRAHDRGRVQGRRVLPARGRRGRRGLVPGTEFRLAGSGWGHFTMFNLRPQDTEEIDARYAETLAD